MAGVRDGGARGPAAGRSRCPRRQRARTWTPAPMLVDQLHFRADRAGYLADGSTHLFVVQAEGGTPRRCHAGTVQRRGAHREWAGSGGNRLDARWQDASSSMAMTTPTPIGSSVCRISMPSTLRPRVGADQPASGFWAIQYVSPDGKSLAYTGFPATTNSYQASDIYVARIDGMGGADRHARARS